MPSASRSIVATLIVLAAVLLAPAPALAAAPGYIVLKDGQTLAQQFGYHVDGMQTWQVLELPFGDDTPQVDPHDWGNVTSEHQGAQPLEGPPLIAVWKQLAPWHGQWASLDQLDVIKPYWNGGTLLLRTPVHVSDVALTLLQCSGGASFAVTHGDTSFFVYATCVPKGTAATPTYVAAYDHTTGTMGARQEVEQARPVNDDHCTPGIVADSQGGLHVVSGSHNAPFMYTHTATPADPTTWAKPVPMLLDGYRIAGKSPRGRQTYVSLVCTPQDRLVVVFRQWRRGVDTDFHGQPYEALCAQWLDPGDTWTMPLRLAFCSRNRGYAQYYQKMSIDRRGRIFLSLSYFRPKDWPVEERAANRYHHRMILMSADGGESWRFATQTDFTGGVTSQQ